MESVRRVLGPWLASGTHGQYEKVPATEMVSTGLGAATEWQTAQVGAREWADTRVAVHAPASCPVGHAPTSVRAPRTGAVPLHVPPTLQLSIKGMTCSACTSAVEAALS